MGHKSDAESMSELTSLMWSRYLKEQVRGELNHEMNAYKAEVVTNHGDGTLTVQRPFESVNLRLKAAPSLAYARAGDMVLVVGIGDKSKALSNAFVLCKADLSDDTTVPVYGRGENILDNWLFAGGGSQAGLCRFPINLNLQTSYSTGWCINRWTIRGTTPITLNNDGIAVSITTSGAFHGMNQPLRSPFALYGQTVTVSVLVKNYNMGSHATYPTFGLYAVREDSSAQLNSSPVLIARIAKNGLNTITGVITYDTVDYPRLNFAAFYLSSNSSNPTGSFKIVAAKAELGDTQTLAHLENGEWVLNEVPDYEEQMTRCLMGSYGNSEETSNYFPVGGKLNASGSPYFRFYGDNGEIYQMVLLASGNLGVQKYDGATWSTLGEYAHI